MAGLPRGLTPPTPRRRRRKRRTRLSSPAIPDMYVPNLLSMKSYHVVLAGNTHEYSLTSHIGKVRIIDTIRNDFSEFLVSKIMDIHLFGVSLSLPLPASILESPEQFLLFGVHRNDRPTSLLEL